MVQNTESLFIQRVEPKDAFEDTVSAELELYGICFVDHIDWIKTADMSGNSYFSAYIYIEKWLENSEVWQDKLQDGIQFGKWFVIINQYFPSEYLIDKENMIYLKDRVNYLNKKMLQLNETINNFMTNKIIESSAPQPTAGAQGSNIHIIQ